VFCALSNTLYYVRGMTWENDRNCQGDHPVSSMTMISLHSPQTCKEIKNKSTG
jgi:hypothetical protein